MAYWLLKSEPGVYAFADLARDKTTTWDGVTNNVALKHIRAMAKGDLAFIYHSGDEKSIVGIADVASEPYPDPKAGNPKIVVVDLRAKDALARPVSLAAIKAKKEFADFALVRISRLSVMPVTAAQWKSLLAMSR